MDLRPAEVTSILKKEIESYQGETSMQSVGTVLSVGDGVARVYGLDDCMMNELLEFSGNVRGVALNLEEDNVGCAVFGNGCRASRRATTVQANRPHRRGARPAPTLVGPRRQRTRPAG